MLLMAFPPLLLGKRPHGTKVALEGVFGYRRASPSGHPWRLTGYIHSSELET
jgi:hypothetical protein